MFEQPTVKNFCEGIQFDLEKAKEKDERKVKSLVLDLNLRGHFVGGVAFNNTVADLLSAQLDETVAAILTKLKRVAETTTLDRQQLREVTGKVLRSYLAALKATAVPSGVQDAHSEQFVRVRLGKLDNQLNHILGQFDVGLPIAQSTTESGAVTNNVNIGTATNAVVQQAGAHSQQSSSVTIEADIAHAALSAFEQAALADAALGEHIDELKSYIGTIRAQLSKPAPNRSLIGEVGRSLRSVIEGVVGNVVSTPVIGTMTTMLRALGLIA
jgi:hypothetical protein